MKQFRMLCSISMLFVIANSFAAKAPIKYGKINSDVFSMTHYAKDSTANAVILCDYTNIGFIYDQNNGFQQHITRNLRIKIFKKEGYEWAKLNFNLSKRYDNMGVIKGCTYNEIDGKIKKTKLERSQIFTEDVNKYWDRVKFEMPAVQEGSVIDIEYNITSKSFRIKDRYFQSEIPTLLSEYRLYIPEYFVFKQLEKGYHTIEDKTTETRSSSISIRQTQGSNNQATRPMQTQSTYRQIDFLETYYLFRSKDIPAFKTEDYITCKKNYLSTIQFELGSVKFPGRLHEDYTQTWQGICKELMLDEDFGGRTRGGYVIRNEIKEIKEQNLSDTEKLEKAFNLIKDNMAWNGYYGKYSYNALKAWKDGEGSVANINLLLVAALNNLDLNAKPVILSTRSNGMIHPAQIILDQYNYVIAAVEIADKTYLLDATDKNTPIGILPKRCLNEKGRIIDKNGGDWISLKPNTGYKNSYRSRISITENGNMKGEMSELHAGYAALAKRNKMDNYNSNEEYIEKFAENMDFDIELDSISNRTKLSEPLKLSYKFELENGIEKMGNLLLVDPIVISKTTENPFKLEKREYPVDFSFPHNTMYSASITIPEGYTVESIPEASRIALPNNAGAYIYSVQSAGNSIVVVSKFIINKVTFLPDEYEHLKSFYNKLIDNQSNKVVLKKI